MDSLAGALRPGRELSQKANGLFRDGVFPEPVGEQKGPIRVAEGAADSNPVILPGRWDPEWFSASAICVGSNRQQIEAYAVPVPQFDLGPSS